MKNKRKPPMLDISDSESEGNEGLISFKSEDEGYNSSPDYVIEEKLQSLQVEIQDMNEKLLLNERYLEEKKLENEELKELLRALQEKYTPRDTANGTGCCNNVRCIII